jgi:hypothetical protein
MSLFNTKFKLIQFTDIQEMILDKLEKRTARLSLLPQC